MRLRDLYAFRDAGFSSPLNAIKGPSKKEGRISSGDPG